jgi:hypothetical protein
MAGTMIRQLAAVGAFTMVLVAAPPAALAQAAQPKLAVEPNAAAPGDEVAVVGRSFPAGAEIGLHLDDINQPPLVTLTVAASGSFQAAVRVPDGVASGPHRVIACRPERSSCVPLASADLRVVAPPPPPPSTTAPPPPPPPASPPDEVAPPPGRESPRGPGDLQASEDPVCCDPPAPEGPDQIQQPPEPAVPPLVNPEGGDPYDANDNFVPDLYVRSIEVTQNIQDLDSSMPLVSDRRTWIRVHPRLLPSHWTLGQIGGAVLLKRGGDERILYPRNLTAYASPSMRRWHPDSALNFLVPEDWDGEGTMVIRALIWWKHPSRIDEEKHSDNNLMSISVLFHDGAEPTIYVMPLDDGGGPGPDAGPGLALEGLLDIYEGLITYHPVADVNTILVPQPIGPGAEASEPGVWDLSTKAGRTEPLKRMLGVHLGMRLDEDARIFGIFDDSVPNGGYTGWANSYYRSTWIQPYVATAAHEGGHLTQLGHVNCVGDEEDGGPLDPSYPNGFPNCSLAPVDKSGHYGFTVLREDPVIYSNDPADPITAFPLMSYSDEGKWSDPYHYCKMLNFYGVRCSASDIGVPGIPIPEPHGHVDCTPEVLDGFKLELCLADPNAPDYDNLTDLDPSDIHLLVPSEPAAWALVSGYLDHDAEEVVIDRTIVVDEPTGGMRAGYEELLAAARNGELTGGSVNQIVVQDSAGSTEFVLPLPADEHAGHGPAGTADDDATIVPFAQVVPLSENTWTLEVRVNRWESATTVPIGLTAPDPPSVQVGAWSKATGLNVSWKAPGDDGEALPADVLWSADGSQWYPMVIGSLANSVDVPPEAGYPGGEVRIKVVVIEDGRTAESVSDPVAVPDRPPLAVISSVTDGATFDRYDPVELRSVSQDPEDGLLDGAALAWTSNLDGELGTGRRVLVDDLSAGTHLVTLAATDTAGATTSAEVTLTVVDTGAPAPLEEGAIPDAERRLRAGSATLPDSWTAPLVVAGLAGLAAALGGGVLLLRKRWRPRGTQVPQSSPG